MSTVLALSRDELEREAIEFSNKLNNMLSTEEKELILLVMPNMLKGRPWAFVGNMCGGYGKEVDGDRLIKYILEGKNKNIRCIGLKNGWLFDYNPGWLVNRLRLLCGTLFSEDDIKRSIEELHENQVKFDSYLSKYGFRGKIGMYNLNMSNYITVEGRDYPAFAVGIEDIIRGWKRYGSAKSGGFGGKLRNNGIKKTFEDLSIAPSCNALLVDLGK